MLGLPQVVRSPSEGVDLGGRRDCSGEMGAKMGEVRKPPEF